MKKVKELFKPFSDAVNYATNESKGKFLQLYNSTRYFEKLKEKCIYYIMGDKGSGKTALALFYEYSPPKKNSAKLLQINNTHYKKFIQLKNEYCLQYEDYASIWRTILLMELAKDICKRDVIRIRFTKIRKLVKECYTKALLPQFEIHYEYRDKAKDKVKIQFPEPINGSCDFSDEKEVRTKSKIIKDYLLEIESAFINQLSKHQLSMDYVVFVDGIDARPDDINYDEYLNCIKGLDEALWRLDTNILREISRKKSLRICLLIRPDIFHKLNIYNWNERINDNTVYIHWQTTETNYRTSALFDTCDKYFYAQNNDDKNCGWNAYFPFKNKEHQSVAFMYFIKKSFIRPRDYFRAIDMLISKNNGDEKKEVFSQDELSDFNFIKEYSDYLLGEIRDYANFYISNSDFEKYIDFFVNIRKAKFSYVDFVDAYKLFIRKIEKEQVGRREYYKNPETLLQFFYDINIIGFVEYFDSRRARNHWAFRERMPNNLSPKVKINDYIQYSIMDGVERSFDF